MTNFVFALTTWALLQSHRHRAGARDVRRVARRGEVEGERGRHDPEQVAGVRSALSTHMFS